jgi:hypothetical protein
MMLIAHFYYISTWSIQCNDILWLAKDFKLFFIFFTLYLFNVNSLQLCIKSGENFCTSLFIIIFHPQMCIVKKMKCGNCFQLSMLIQGYHKWIYFFVSLLFCFIQFRLIGFKIQSSSKCILFRWEFELVE